MTTAVAAAHRAGAEAILGDFDLAQRMSPKEFQLGLIAGTRGRLAHVVGLPLDEVDIQLILSLTSGDAEQDKLAALCMGLIDDTLPDSPASPEPQTAQPPRSAESLLPSYLHSRPPVEDMTPLRSDSVPTNDEESASDHSVESFHREVPEAASRARLEYTYPLPQPTLLGSVAAQQPVAVSSFFVYLTGREQIRRACIRFADASVPFVTIVPLETFGRAGNRGAAADAAQSAA